MRVESVVIRAVHEMAKAAGATRLYWQTHETNLAAQQLYEKVPNVRPS